MSKSSNTSRRGIKTEILNLYNLGFNYTEIQKKLNCSRGTISYHLGGFIQEQKEILKDTSKAKIKPEQLHVTSTRVGSVIGQHSVMFDSDADTIEITHTAKNRRGFALGALLAAEWIIGKKGVYTMKDVMSSL